MSERSIFLAALDIADPVQRAAYLDQACAGDARLRRHVEELIAAEAKLGGFLNRPHADVERTEDFAPLVERPGTHVGPYKLMEQIGEGGFGLVFVAEQQQPVRRKVALKVIKPGMDSREVIARFEAERQALALMDHPHIARVLDAGTTESGRPYFVMELVRGVPITEYCDAQHLTPRQRLKLFVDVCHAVQHAHQKGVIHRDLKPNNILVAPHDGVPVVKVIDFGVAKALGQQLTEKTVYTRFAQMIGTPLYMSPEQAEINALDVDTRSDVYSLGVLLYELLTGTTPFDKKRLASAAFDEIRRIIKEEEPARPSTRVSTLGESLTLVSSHRGTDPGKLGQLLRGDLDVIVMKALEKERGRRYDTPNALADDIRRYLEDEAIVARPASPAYRLKKFVQRNRVAVAAFTAIASVLLLGTTISTWLAIRESRANQLARQSLAEAQQQRQLALTAKDEAERERDRAEKAKAEESTQRARAEEREAEAKTARMAETEQRQQAEQERNNALAARNDLRHTLYASEMNLVQAAWESQQYRRVTQILQEQPPDLRGFEWRYWDRRLRGDVVRTVALRELGAAYSMSFVGGLHLTADGSRVIGFVSHRSKSPPKISTGTVVWDTATGQIVQPFQALPAPAAEGQARSFGGMSLLSITEDGSHWVISERDRVFVRDGTTSRDVTSWTVPNLSAHWIQISPDGKRVLIAGQNTSFGPRTTSGQPTSLPTTLPLSAGRSRLSLVIVPAVQEELGLTAEQKQQLQQLRLERLEATRTLPSTSGWPSGRTVVRIPGRASVWNVDSQTEEYSFTAGSRLGERCAFSPDGKKVLAITTEGEVFTTQARYRQTVELLDAQSGKSVWKRDRDSPFRLSLRAWHPDSRLVALASLSASEQPCIELWDADAGEAVATLARSAESHNYESNAAFSLDGRWLASANYLDEVEVWDVQAALASVREAPGRPQPPHHTFYSPGQRIASVAFAADGSHLYGLTASSVVMWRLAAVGSPASVLTPAMRFTTTDASERRSEFLLQGEANAISVRSSGAAPRTPFRVWDLATNAALFEIEADITKVLAISSDRQHVLGVSGSTTRAFFGRPNPFRLHFYDSRTKQTILATLSDDAGATPPSARQDAAAGAIHPDQTLFAVVTGPQTGTIRTSGRIVVQSWDAHTGELRWSHDFGVATPFYRAASGALTRSTRLSESVHLLSYSPDGRQLAVATAATGNDVQFFNSQSGQRERTQTLAAPPLWIGFSQQRVAGATANEVVWHDLASGNEVVRLRGLEGVFATALSPDGSRAAVLSVPPSVQGDFEISLWSMATGRRLLTLRSREPIDQIAFSPDGQRLYAVPVDSTLPQPCLTFDATPLTDPHAPSPSGLAP